MNNILGIQIFLCLLFGSCEKIVYPFWRVQKIVEEKDSRILGFWKKGVKREKV